VYFQRHRLRKSVEPEAVIYQSNTNCGGSSQCLHCNIGGFANKLGFDLSDTRGRTPYSLPF
jgi:hypothetical protein